MTLKISDMAIYDIVDDVLTLIDSGYFGQRQMRDVIANRISIGFKDMMLTRCEECLKKQNLVTA